MPSSLQPADALGNMQHYITVNMLFFLNWGAHRIKYLCKLQVWAIYDTGRAQTPKKAKEKAIILKQYIVLITKNEIILSNWRY